MLTEEQVKNGLGAVLVPGVMRTLGSLNLVRGIAVSARQVEVTLSSAALPPAFQETITTRVEEVIRGLDETVAVKETLTAAAPAQLNQVRQVVAVMSGKGGVGKSLVAALSAIALRRQGFEVGILDADITGPSIPKMFGITGQPSGNESGILPVLSRSGISIMSINLLLPGEDEAVIWRGPPIGRAITQFWEEVLWGRLDYLVVDLPPGTADAPLTVMQSLPVSGVVLVSTPQQLAGMVVRKAVKMVRQMNKPVLGIVENMSYPYVPEPGKRVAVFGESRGQEMAKAAGALLLAQLPVDPNLARLCDEGNIEQYEAEAVARLGESLTAAVPVPTGPHRDDRLAVDR